MIYRALVDLDTGKRIIHNGKIFPSKWLQPRAIEILEKQNKIAPASLPPVTAVPRLKTYKAAFKRIGIENAGEVLELDDNILAKTIKSTEAEARQYKAELYAQFDTPHKKN